MARATRSGSSRPSSPRRSRGSARRSARRSLRLRSAELARLGLHLPALATICPHPLPPGRDWPAILDRAGFDVLATGAVIDSTGTWGAATAARSHRPMLARPGDREDAESLVAAGCRLLTWHGALDGAYAYRRDERAVLAVRSGPEVEDLSDVAATILTAARAGSASELWVTCESLAHLPAELVEAKLAVLAEGAVQARLWLAKEQFD